MAAFGMQMNREIETLEEHEYERLRRDIEGSVRNQIYHDLHTRVLNRLRSLGLSCQTAVHSDNLDSLRIKLAEVDSETRGIIREIRRIVAPPWYREEQEIMEEESSLILFINEIEGHIQKIRENFGMEIEFRYLPQEAKLLSPQQFLPIQDLLYNLLDNAIRHAKAHNVLIHLYASDERPSSSLTLEFTTDGQGHSGLNDIERFVEQLPQAHRGLRSVVSAVKRLGAELRASSSADRGTTIVIDRIPILK